MRKLLYILLLLCLSCKGLGPSAIGSAAEELLFLVPGDKMYLDIDKFVYVDGDGMLRGFPQARILAAGRKVRDVMNELIEYIPFERYQFVHYGKRYIQVGGAIGRSGNIPYPAHEDWNMMNLLSTLEGPVHVGRRREYLIGAQGVEFFRGTIVHPRAIASV